MVVVTVCVEESVPVVEDFPAGWLSQIAEWGSEIGAEEASEYFGVFDYVDPDWDQIRDSGVGYLSANEYSYGLRERAAWLDGFCVGFFHEACALGRTVEGVPGWVFNVWSGVDARYAC